MKKEYIQSQIKEICAELEKLDNCKHIFKRLKNLSDNMLCKHKDPKTEKSKRTMEIPIVLVDQLQKYKTWYENKRNEMGDAWAGNEGYIFVNLDTGRRSCVGVFNGWLDNITNAAGLEHFTVHSMRHTNITMKLRNNVPLLETSADAGHSRPSTTTDRYGHFLKTEQRRAPKVLDNIFMLPLAK